MLREAPLLLLLLGCRPLLPPLLSLPRLDDLPLRPCPREPSRSRLLLWLDSSRVSRGVFVPLPFRCGDCCCIPLPLLPWSEFDEPLMKVELLTELLTEFPIELLLTELTGEGGRATDPATDPPARLPELDMALFLNSSRPLR